MEIVDIRTIDGVRANYRVSFAQGFTTGSFSQGYILGSIETRIRLSGINVADGYRAELWSSTGSGVPGRKLVSLRPPPKNASDGTHNLAFTAPLNTRLAANTTYHLVLYRTDGATDSLRVVESTAEDAGGEAGFSIADTPYTADSSPPDGTWRTISQNRPMFTRVNGSRVGAVTVPAPESLSVAASGYGGLGLSWTAPSGTVTGYEVDYTASATAADGAAASGRDPAAGWVAADRHHADTATSQSLSNLPGGAAHRVRVRAVDDGVAGAWAFGAGKPRVAPAGLVWSATLVVQDLAGTTDNGCDNAQTAPALKCSTPATLSEDEFSAGGQGYRITTVVVSPSGYFQLQFDGALNTAARALKFCVGTQAFALSSNDVQQSGTPLRWSPGDTVSLSIASSCPPAPAPQLLRGLDGRTSTDRGSTFSGRLALRSVIDANVIGWTAAVGASVTHVELTPLTDHARAEVRVGKRRGGQIDSPTLLSADSPSAVVALDGGTTVIRVWAIPPSGNQEQENYTLTVRRGGGAPPGGGGGGGGAGVTPPTVTPPPPPPASPTVTLSASPNPVAEGSPVTVTATLSRALSGAVAIPVRVTRDTSEAGDHGTLSALAVAAGTTSATGTIATHRDADGADETFTVALGALPSQVTAGTPASVTVTIDDDALGVAAPAPELAFFPAASGTLGGLARVVNRSDESGTVRIRAFDDAGEEYPVQTLTLGAGQAMGFRPAELEAGHEAKGLPGTGDGAGNWRLVFESALDLRVFGLVRQPDGGLAPVHDPAPGSAAGGYEAVFFNPAGNRRFASRLRVVNHADATAAVRITGTDDAGEAGESAVTLTVPARAACTLRAPELESGEWEAGEPGPGCGGLAGGLGDGAGKWRLMVTSNQPLAVLSLLRSAAGRLTNVSSAPAGAAAGARRLALLPPADDPLRQGFVRLVNRDAREGTVMVRAFDDAGEAYPVQTTHPLGAGRVMHFSARDLEEGNAEQGLTGVGEGAGNWRLVVEPEPADLDLQALAYVRNPNLVSLAALHDTAPESSDGAHEIAFFNPASNRGLQSRLRLVNRADAPAAVTIAGTDAAGEPGESAVTLTLPARAACTLRATELESGAWEDEEPGPGCGALAGRLSDGAGKWRLVVTADQPLGVMSLLRHAASGALANLSTARE